MYLLCYRVVFEISFTSCFLKYRSKCSRLTKLVKATKKIFNGVLKKAHRCNDNVSESMQVSQERPINITRVSETHRRTSWERRKDQSRSRLTVLIQLLGFGWNIRNTGKIQPKRQQRNESWRQTYTYVDKKLRAEAGSRHPEKQQGLSHPMVRLRSAVGQTPRRTVRGCLERR